MLYKVGDRVKFLNEKGGGIVSKVISSTLVNVAIEDGFEIPTLTSNLIKINPEDMAGRMFQEDIRVTLPEASREAEKEYRNERVSPLGRYRTPQPEPPGIYLAFHPHDQKWVITGPIDVYLINYSEYQLIFSLFLRNSQGNYRGVDYDSVDPGSKLIISTLHRDQLQDWEEGVVQALFHKDSTRQVPLPLSAAFRIRNTRFLTEGNYRASAFLEGKALMYSLCTLSGQPTVSEYDEIAKADQAPIEEKIKKPLEDRNFLNKHKTRPGEAEVDLHIEALREDFASLDPGKTLDIQTDYFVKCLEKAIEEKLHRLVFIHGVGNGTLKSVITGILKTYEDIEVKDASMSKYGSGATEIRIK